jgi:hypothetical protein
MVLAIAVPVLPLLRKIGLKHWPRNSARGEITGRIFPRRQNGAIRTADGRISVFS